MCFVVERVEIKVVTEQIKQVKHLSFKHLSAGSIPARLPSLLSGLDGRFSLSLPADPCGLRLVTGPGQGKEPNKASNAPPPVKAGVIFDFHIRFFIPGESSFFMQKTAIEN